MWSGMIEKSLHQMKKSKSNKEKERMNEFCCGMVEGNTLLRVVNEGSERSDRKYVRHSQHAMEGIERSHA